MISESIGQEIANCRRDLGWSQQHLADLAGVHRNTVRALEAGELVHARVTTIDKLAEVLGITILLPYDVDADK